MRANNEWFAECKNTIVILPCFEYIDVDDISINVHLTGEWGEVDDISISSLTPAARQKLWLE
jgi:hypothetical protein